LVLVRIPGIPSENDLIGSSSSQINLGVRKSFFGGVDEEICCPRAAIPTKIKIKEIKKHFMVYTICLCVSLKCLVL
jgi:hypothetical protein